jgi:hypothetical protein
LSMRRAAEHSRSRRITTNASPVASPSSTRRLPKRVARELRVKFATEDRELAQSAVLAWQDQCAIWKGGSVGTLRIIDLVAIVADFSGAQRPMLAVIMQALVERGWRIEGNTRTMIDPDGNAYTLADAIGAQTLREIGEA